MSHLGPCLETERLIIFEDIFGIHHHARSWAEGQRLTPCLAFRDDGPYKAHLVGHTKVPTRGACGALIPRASAPAGTVSRGLCRSALGSHVDSAEDGSSWNALNWEAEEAAN